MNMNVSTILAAIVALLTGLAAGNYMGEQPTPSQNETNANEYEKAEYTPAAEDYVSLRPTLDSLPTELLTDEERAGLLLMREEEKLARDVYQTLYEKWGLQIFANIAQSEQTHTEAVRDLLNKYDVTDPVTDDTVGVFTDQNLADLYRSLVAAGTQSETDALTVGATIEDLDISDLARLLTQTDNEDITLVYENLLRGSRNHLRAFTRQLTAQDATYTAQYISSTELETITSTNQERGSTAGRTGSGGRGWGGGKR